MNKIVKIVNNHNSESKYKIDYDCLVQIIKGDKYKAEKVFEDIVMKDLVKTMELDYSSEWRSENNGLERTCYSIARKYYPVIEEIKNNSRVIIGLFNRRLKAYDYLKFEDGTFFVDSDRMNEDMTIYLTNDKQVKIYNLCLNMMELYKDFANVGIERYQINNLICDDINYEKILRYD